MARQTYEGLVQAFQGVGPGLKTFEIDGISFPYPGYCLYGKDAESLRLEYRKHVSIELSLKRLEDGLVNLPLQEKLRRYSKNAGLELLAGTIEGLACFLWIGGIHLNCDNIRDAKEPTYLGYMRECFLKADGIDRF